MVPREGKGSKELEKEIVEPMVELLCADERFAEGLRGKGGMGEDFEVW